MKQPEGCDQPIILFPTAAFDLLKIIMDIQWINLICWGGTLFSEKQATIA